MIIIILISKILIFTIRFLHLGGGTSLPGLWIEKYFPKLITKLSKNYEQIVLVTGTNGKTTTQKLITFIVQSQNINTTSNTSGANLIRGIASSLLENSNFFGKSKNTIAIFEVEEASMPIITKLLKATQIIVTNLYRDQLDLYGELFKTRELIYQSIKNSPNASLILNGDDPNVSSLCNDFLNNVILFSLKDKRKKDILFEKKWFKLTRSTKINTIIAENIRFNEDLTTIFDVFYKNKTTKEIHFHSPGIHYIYNALAGFISIKNIIKITDLKLKKHISNFNPAFGRGEIITYNNKKIELLLVKNPASMTSNIRMLSNIPNLKLLFIINDNTADGRDISWLWDSKFEYLIKENINFIVSSGTRAFDMNLRLKYANLPKMYCQIEPNIKKALDLTLSKMKFHDTLYVLATYTAMLELRNYIKEFIKIKQYWK